MGSAMEKKLNCLFSSEESLKKSKMKKIKEFYRNLFKITKADVFRNGDWKMLETVSVADNSDFTFENLLAWEWRYEIDLRIVVINYNNFNITMQIKI